MDYNIFLMSRVREEAARHGTDEGMLRALVATGPVITSAGLILAGTFSVLMVLPIWDLFEIGFAVALGVLIDTFVVRSIAVPPSPGSRRRAWWPSRPPAARRGSGATRRGVHGRPGGGAGRVHVRDLGPTEDDAQGREAARPGGTLEPLFRRTLLGVR